MPYFEIGLCIVGASLYFNAGKLEANAGKADHSVLWASLSVLTSVLALAAGAGWVLWLIAQIALLIAIALGRMQLPRD